MSREATLAEVKVGQRFTWVPAAWYGECKLLTKRKIPHSDIVWKDGKMKFVSNPKFDITFDAAVVNPPGVIYGEPGSTKVLILGES